jgi:murein DD-endopeptidase MepM/ murein hydrolase activator NlpD
MAVQASRLVDRARSRPVAVGAGVVGLMLASAMIVPAAGAPVATSAAMPPMGSGIAAAVAQSSAVASAAAEAQAAAEQARLAVLKFYPCDGASVTARYGQRGGWSSGYHTGTDFAAGTGTPVKAAMGGTVIATGYNGAYGNQVQVEHADGTVTTYNHLSSISARRGQEVSGGTVLGKVGSTGRTSGPHLHFEVISPDGSFRDPIAWLNG